MIETTVIENLRKKFPDEKIYAEVPEGMPDRFITVEKTGSQQTGIGLFQSTLAVQSWEMSKLKAADMSHEVCAVLRNLPDETDTEYRDRAENPL